MPSAGYRSTEQQRLDGHIWAAEVRRGSTVAEIAARHEVSDEQIRRDLRTSGYLLAALQAEVPPAELISAWRDPPERPAWTRLSERDIAFLHMVRDEIRAADRVSSINRPASL